MSRTKTKHKVYYWITADGRKLRIKDMTTSHLRNAIWWCEDRAGKESVVKALASVEWIDPRMFKHNTGETYKAMKRELRTRMQ